MDGRYTTTIPAFVRTSAGVVHLAEGAELPAETLETEYVRLAAAGVITESPTPEGDKPARGKRSGQPGSTREG